jgi:hypothetical protein
MEPYDDPRRGAAGAGVSPTDPGAPGPDRRRGAGGGAGAATGDDLVSAVEDLVRDLLPDDEDVPADCGDRG